MKISQIEKEDLQGLNKLYNELSGGLNSNLEKMQEVLSFINNNDDYYLIGAKGEDNNLLGSIMGIVCKDIYGECRPFMVIENVIVSSSARRMGIGRALFNYIEDVARKRNCYYIIFTSSSYRKEAHKFYESIGYPKDMVQGFKKFLD